MRKLTFCALFAAGCVPHLYSSNEVGTTPWELPSNNWSEGRAGPPAGLVGAGFAIGDVAPDLRLVDQFGNTVSTWQFYGDVLVIDVSTLWCSPCQALAETAQETQDEYGPQGFTYVTVLQEDLEGGPPENDDLNAWVDLFELTAPVLGDGDKVAIEATAAGQYPGLVLVGRDMVVLDRVTPPEDGVLRAAIEGAL